MAGDEVDGADPGLRAELEARQVGCVLAVACDHRVSFGGEARRVDALAARVPARAWQQVSCGPGAKGHRYDDWAFCRLDQGGQVAQHWLMVRRHQRTGELAYYRCFMPHRCRWPSSSVSPGGAERSRSVSRPPRAWSAWTSTRFAAGAAGTAGPL